MAVDEPAPVPGMEDDQPAEPRKRRKRKRSSLARAAVAIGDYMAQRERDTERDDDWSPRPSEIEAVEQESFERTEPEAPAEWRQMVTLMEQQLGLLREIKQALENQANTSRFGM
jgi:hypothetical protein